MAKITEVSVNYGVTRGTAVKFEFVRLDYQMKAELEPGDDAKNIASQLRKLLRVDVEHGVREEIAWQQGDKQFKPSVSSSAQKVADAHQPPPYQQTKPVIKQGSKFNKR